MRLGVIADDFTGASDLGNMLTRAGMETELCIGVPQANQEVSADCAVIALKTRSLPPAQAVMRMLEALEWLIERGCQQFYFKYCSTFDSTRDGNIGPVLDAFADRLNAPRAVVVPAFPETGRRVFMGHLFVHDTLLERSGMGTHPLTPMTESDLRIWLGHQTDRPIGHVDAETVRAGPDAIRAAFDATQHANARYIVVDTIENDDLTQIGAAVADDVLVSGGSGLGLALPANFGLQPSDGLPWQGRRGRAVALAGSCSFTTQEQVARHAQSQPCLRLDPLAIHEGRQTPALAADWVIAQPEDSVPLVTSTMAPDALAEIQARLGREESASLLETFFGALTFTLVEAGFERIIVGGGETSGAAISALSIERAHVGPQIAPGVPALRPEGRDFVCTLKSGNFGNADFFSRAADVLAGALS